MKIVIDIPKKTYSYIKRECVENDFDSPMNHAMNGIKNGTPIPKGHGRLKDVDKLESHDEYDGQGFTESVYKDDIDDLPTIIEADTEESEEE